MLLRESFLSGARDRRSQTNPGKTSRPGRCAISLVKRVGAWSLFFRAWVATVRLESHARSVNELALHGGLRLVMLALLCAAECNCSQPRQILLSILQVQP